MYLNFQNMICIYKSALVAVYKCKSPTTNENIAIKSYNKSLLNKYRYIDVYSEIEILSNLNHKNIISYIDYYEDSSSINIIQEYIDHDLYYVSRLKKLNENYICNNIIKPLLSAVNYLHSQNIIHRDIKLENILIQSNRVIKLCDFNLSIDKSKHYLIDKVGTPEYMAPEIICVGSINSDIIKQTIADKKSLYDERVDIWSIGILLFELYFGKTPFFSPDSKELEHNILYSSIDKHKLGMHYISDNAIDFMLKLLEKNYKKRPFINDILQYAWLNNTIHNKINFEFNKPEIVMNTISGKRDRRGSLPNIYLNKIETITNTDNIRRDKRDSLPNLNLNDNQIHNISIQDIYDISKYDKDDSKYDKDESKCDTDESKCDKIFCCFTNCIKNCNICQKTN